MSPHEMRIGDREREAAVAALGEHYVAGRLSKEEYDERSGVAWQARTNADLAPLFHDLPALQAPRPAPHPARRPVPQGRPRRYPGPPVLPILLLVLVLALVMKAWPVMLLLLVVFLWFKVFGGRVWAGSRRDRRRR